MDRQDVRPGRDSLSQSSALIQSHKGARPATLDVSSKWEGVNSEVSMTQSHSGLPGSQVFHSDVTTITTNDMSTLTTNTSSNVSAATEKREDTTQTLPLALFKQTDAQASLGIQPPR